MFDPIPGAFSVSPVRVGAIPGGHHHGAVPPHGEFVAVGACHHRQAPRLGPGVHLEPRFWSVLVGKKSRPGDLSGGVLT